MYAGRRAANATTATTSTATNNGGSNSNGGMRNKSSGTARAKESQPQQQQFHPKLIATQIVALQCFHYFLLTVFLQINSVLYGKSVTIDRIFTDKHVKLWHTNGWADAFAILLASLAG
jgi:Integral membrane protein S linking to the trans Golgi network